MGRITRASHGELVEVSRNRMGDVTVHPVTLGMQKTIRERSNTPDVLMHGAYIQGDEADRFLSELSKGARATVRRGWPAKCYIGDEQALCLFGVEY